RAQVPAGPPTSYAALEDSRGPDEQHDDQQDIGHRLVDLGRQEQRRELLDEPEQQAAHERARIVARSAEDDHEGAFESADLAQRRQDRHQYVTQRTPGGRQRGRDAEREQVYALDVDTAHLRHFPALRYRADGLAETGPTEEDEGGQRDGDRKAAGDDPRL